MSEEYIQIEPKLRDSDGLTRYCVSTYFYFGGSDKIIMELEAKTKLRWKYLGTYMDTACFATPDHVTDHWKIPLP